MGTGTPVTEDEIITPEKMNLKLESSPDNILKGLLGVAADWGTDPTDLENATDGDLAIVTGTGVTIKGAGGTYGTLTFDLGSIKTVLLSGRFGLWSTASTTRILAESSDDNITYRSDWTNLCDITTTAEKVIDSKATILTGRYARIKFHVNAAATANAKIYEVMAWKLTI